MFQSMLLVVLCAATVSAAEFPVISPDGKIAASLTFDENAGTLSYTVSSGGAAIIEKSAVGITTNKADFTRGMKLSGTMPVEVNETYTLPAGKRSTYINRANELVIKLTKDQAELHVRFRAYDDGVAYSYAIPGQGEIEISSETSSFALSGGDISYWGQNHPNNYGYETMLGKIDSNRFSVPALAKLGERNHFVFLAQAATYGTYIMPNFKREGATLSVAFPMDQEGPVKTALPFASPWRLAVISPNTLAKVVETTMLENLNPPTQGELVNADWIKAGRASWDFLAKDRQNTPKWIDFDKQMGWEYHLVDAGFQRTLDVPKITAYAKEKGVRVIGWAHVRGLAKPEDAQTLFAQYAGWGLAGAKLDFFDHNSFNGERRTNDYEDTQASLQIRDRAMQLAIKHKMVLEFHGCTLPSGERRRYPHFMAAEGVAGMEKRNGKLENDLTIPFTRNIMGPTSYTVVKFDRSLGSHAYQVAQAIVYETGIQIYAELHEKILSFKGVEMLKKIPANWDEIKFIDGLPESHAIFARRKGDDWFIGGITKDARTAKIGLAFLKPNTAYTATIYRDGATKTDLLIEEKRVTSADEMEIALLASGGCAVHFSPAK